MALTLEELKERLKQLDETILIELLQIDADSLVEKYVERIERNFEDLETQLEDVRYE